MTAAVGVEGLPTLRVVAGGKPEARGGVDEVDSIDGAAEPFGGVARPSVTRVDGALAPGTW